MRTTRLAVVAALAAAGLCSLAGTALANTVSITSSSEGDLKVSPGDWLSVGYGLSEPGNSTPNTVTIAGGTVTLPYTCTHQSSATPTGVVTIPLPQASYQVTGSGFYPSGSGASSGNTPATFEAAAQAPNACNGGTLYLQYNGTEFATFHADIQSTTPGVTVNVQFHYDDAATKASHVNVDCANPGSLSTQGCAASWSATAGVAADPTPPGACPTGSALGAANAFTEFATGTVTRGSAGSTDDEGAIAAGGTATFTNLYDGIDLPSGAKAFVGGGNVSGSLTFESGSVGTFAGSSSATDVGSSKATAGLTHAGAPFSFSSVGQQLATDSATYGGEAQTAGATVSTSGAELDLTGSSATLDVFDLAPGQFAAAHDIAISVPTGATVLVNVPDSSVVTSQLAYVAYDGEDIGYNPSTGQQNQYGSAAAEALREHTLFNFPSATRLSLSNTGFEGHILAPSAAFSITSGQLDGSVAAASDSGDYQANDTPPFAGCPS